LSRGRDISAPLSAENMLAFLAENSASAGRESSFLTPK
jgi:hypothetical protein